jgi:hypothetical protein
MLERTGCRQLQLCGDLDSGLDYVTELLPSGAEGARPGSHNAVTDSPLISNPYGDMTLEQCRTRTGRDKLPSMRMHPALRFRVILVALVSGTCLWAGALAQEPDPTIKWTLAVVPASRRRRNMIRVLGSRRAARHMS